MNQKRREKEEDWSDRVLKSKDFKIEAHADTEAKVEADTELISANKEI